MKSFVIPRPGDTPPAPAQPAGPSARQAKTKNALVLAGGKRLPVNVPAQAVADLEQIKVRDGIKTNSEAVIAAIQHYARYMR